MNQTTQELKNELERTLAELATLRDEVRVKLHLAGMDAKDRWKELEDELLAAERAAADAATEATRAALTDVTTDEVGSHLGRDHR